MREHLSVHVVVEETLRPRLTLTFCPVGDQLSVQRDAAGVVVTV